MVQSANAIGESPLAENNAKECCAETLTAGTHDCSFVRMERDRDTG